MSALRSKWIYGILSIYSIALFTSYGKAVYSISSICMLFILLPLYYPYKNKDLDNCIYPDPCFFLIYLPFFIVIVILSLITRDWASVSVAGTYWYWATPAIWLYCICQKIEINKKMLISLLTISLWILCVPALVKYFFFPLPGVHRVMGEFTSANVFATMVELNLTFYIPIVLLGNHTKERWHSWVCYTTIALGGIALILSGSRGGLLAVLGSAIITGMLYAYIKKIPVQYIKRAIGVLICIIGIGISGMLLIGNRGLHQSYDGERILLLQSTYHMWDDHKILGIGLAHWPEEYKSHYISPAAKEPNLKIPHNVTAYFFAATGTLGGLAYLLYAFGVYAYMYKKLKEQPYNTCILAFMWASLALTLHGFVDAGIMMGNGLKLYSGLLGITLSMIVKCQHREERKKIYE